MSIEFEDQYSGSLKSLNLRDFGKFMEDDQSNKDNIYTDKSVVFSGEKQSFEDLVEEIGFRGFNIDLEPKFILS